VPQTPATPTTAQPGTPGTNQPATPGTGVATPLPRTGALPNGGGVIAGGAIPPGTRGPEVTVVGCVRHVERTSTDQATVADVLSRPVTAYVIEPARGESGGPVYGVISANDNVRLEKEVGRHVEATGSLRAPFALGPPPQGADSIKAQTLQPVVVTSMRATGEGCP
jgi:hypothetical protein